MYHSEEKCVILTVCLWSGSGTGRSPHKRREGDGPHGKRRWIPIIIVIWEWWLPQKCFNTKIFLLEMSGNNHSQMQVSVTATSCDEENHTNQDVLEENVYEEEPVPDQNKSTTTTVGDVLSVRQLVFRRGLTLLFMLLILAVGIIASRFLTTLLQWPPPIAVVALLVRSAMVRSDRSVTLRVFLFWVNYGWMFAHLSCWEPTSGSCVQRLDDKVTT